MANNNSNNEPIVHIVAIAKNEYNYIKEWVEYHIKLGFDKIIIYDNNDVNGERYDELLSKFIQRKKVEIRDRRGQKGQQCKVYNEYYKEGNFDWLFVIDLDEFITFGPETNYKNVKDFVKTFKDDADMVSLFWRCYGDNGQLSNTGESVLERFKTPLPTNICNKNQTLIYNSWYKTFTRKGLDIELSEHGIGVNHMDRNLVINNCFGDVFNQCSPVDFLESTYEKGVFVRHYITKTIEEWEKCKLKRGHANDPNSNEDVFVLNSKEFAVGWSYAFDTFFQFNELTPDKIKILRDRGYDFDIYFHPKVLMCILIDSEDLYPDMTKYIDNIRKCCCLKTCIGLSDRSFPDKPIFQQEFKIKNLIPYTTSSIIRNNWDLKEITGLSNNFRNFGDDINCIVNIGAPKSLDEETVKDYNNQLNQLFGDENVFKKLLDLCISKNTMIVPKGGLVNYNSIKNENFLNSLNKTCSIIGANATHTLFSKYNIFIAPYKPFYEKIIGKNFSFNEQTNEDIIKNSENNSITDYNVTQFALYKLFDKISYVQ